MSYTSRTRKGNGRTTSYNIPTRSWTTCLVDVKRLSASWYNFIGCFSFVLYIAPFSKRDGNIKLPFFTSWIISSRRRISKSQYHSSIAADVPLLAYLVLAAWYLAPKIQY
jgi:hypothetical protein